MGQSHFSSRRDREMYESEMRQKKDAAAALIEQGRRELAAKIVMAVVDKIVAEIIRPGPKPEERECYEVAGELRAIVPELEHLAVQIIDVNGGVR